MARKRMAVSASDFSWERIRKGVIAAPALEDAGKAPPAEMPPQEREKQPKIPKLEVVKPEELAVPQKRGPEGGTFMEHAQHWVESRGLLKPESDYEGMLGEAVLEMARQFSEEGHSGMSAKLARAYFNWLCDAWDGMHTMMLNDEDHAKALAALEKCDKAAVVEVLKAVAIKMSKAEEPKGKLSSLKMPDPAFNIARLRAGQRTGLISRLPREARVDEQQFLVNETAPTDQPPQVWGVITLGAPEGPFKQLADIPDKARQGLDQFTLREFSTENDIWFIPMKLIAAYEPPIQLKEPPPGRRFGGEVELPADVKKSILVYGDEYYRGQMEPDLGFVQELSEVSKQLDGSHILEIGMGTGRAMKVLQQSGVKVEGVDSSDWAVMKCLQSGLQVLKADATCLPFPTNSFDSTFSMHVMEHVADIEQAVKESLRVCKCRAVHLVPLGLRMDPTHAHTWLKFQDLKDAVLGFSGLEGVAKQFHRIFNSPSGLGGDVAIFTLDKSVVVQHPVLEHVQPFTVIPDFVSLVGGSVKSSSPNDIDILIRSGGPFAGMELRLRNLMPAGEARDKLHFVYNPPGPHDDHIPLFDLVAVPKRSFRVAKIEKAKDLKPLVRFTPLKTAVGYTQQEFFAPEQLWELWAKGFIEAGTAVDVEEKFNGLRAVLEVDGSGRSLIFFEDSKGDRSRQFPGVVQDLKALKSDGGVIFDCDLGATFKSGKTVPRTLLSTLVSSHESVPENGLFKLPSGDDAQLRIRCFDCLFLDGQDLHTLPWTDRRKKLEEAFGRVDFKLLKMSEKNITNSKAAFLKVVKEVSKRDGSEGAVGKAVNSDYPLSGQSFAWAKVKNSLEIKVQVIDRKPVSGTSNQWNYVVGYIDQNGKLHEMGKTFNTKVNAKPGDVLTLEAEEVIPKYDEKEGWLATTVVPKVSDLETGSVKPESVESIIRRAFEANVLQADPSVLERLHSAKILKSLVEKAGEGNMDFSEGDEGVGIFQTHERGLFEQQVKLTDSFGWDPVELTDAQIARLSKLAGSDVGPAVKQAQAGNSSKLDSMLNKVIGHGDTGKAGPEFDKLPEADRKLLALASPVSVHTDFRLRRGKDPYWEGGEGFTPGNQFKESKIRNIQSGDEPGKVLMNFKAPRKGEEPGKGADIVRGPIVWLRIGLGKPQAFPPGSVGSTVNAWSRFRVRESFKWIAGVQDEHFKEFWIIGGPISGRWLIQFAPVGPGAAQAEGRAWMLSRPKDQEPKSEALRDRVSKGVDVTKSLWCPIVKADDEKRLVTGVVLQPEVTDAQGDVISEDVIEEAAHNFVADYNRSTQLGVQHKGFPPGIQLVESWIAPVDMNLGKPVKKGTWLMTVHVTNDDIWGKVKAGLIRGFSIGGLAKVKRLQD